MPDRKHSRYKTFQIKTFQIENIPDRNIPNKKDKISIIVYQIKVKSKLSIAVFI